MKVGLVGFAGSGKTTVFNAMTGLDAPVGYGGESRLGTVRVPDPRVNKLSAMFMPRRTTFADVTFSDVPGEHGAARASLSPRGIHRLREQDALCMVIGDFGVPGAASADPEGDLAAFHHECLFADLEILSRRLDRLRKERADALEIAVFERAVEALEGEEALRTLPANKLNRHMLRGFSMLTDRPLLVVVNVNEERATESIPPPLDAALGELGAAGVVLCAEVEAEIAAMEPLERDGFLEYLGVTEPAINRFIRLAYGALNLISFFTVGPDEVRAWTIAKGTRARQAAGTIHSDMERGFIRAEITPWDALVEHGSESSAKKAGALRVEGKDYVVRDGDVMHVRFNV